ncbi:plasminogen activator, urokinase a [Paramisgurnus dabryanus]|uniref:plasminogen activator, urokinase a n=1 Tax=Paramisgurnus dabryanus TaxID=90735 RepID=UPI0031F3FFC8
MVEMKCAFSILLLTCALWSTDATYQRSPIRHRGISDNLIQHKGRGDECFSDDSESEVSVTVSGRRCVHWNLIPSKTPIPSLKRCNHNYCRNPDKSIKPWCMVRKRYRWVREYCDIPKVTKPTMRPTKPDPPQDTELTCGERNLPRMSKIVGGLRTGIESQPWIASIFIGPGFSCGGTLISPCWVLTAAHCFPAGKRTKIHKYSVYLGKNSINETDSKEQKFMVSKLVVHPDFDYTTENYNHDIALLQIVNSDGQCATKTNSVRTACLPPFQQMVPSGFYCEIAGYGRYKNGGFDYSRHLKTAKVKLVSQNVCQNEYYSKDEVSNNMFCAAGRNWEDDACQGDSGGPLLCEMSNTMFLFGIISWGKECATKSNPGVYTKVTNYNHWIAEHTGLPTYTKGSRYPQKY